MNLGLCKFLIVIIGLALLAFCNDVKSFSSRIRPEAPANLNPVMAGKIPDLEAFTKLYGYVRFFHPSDEAASINWDTFAGYGAQKMLDANSTDATLQVLKDLFVPLAPSISLYKTGGTSDFDLSKIIPKDTSGLKVVAWQHRGVGLGTRSLYQSSRTNRFAPIGSGFGGTLQSIPAGPYRGKTVRFRASVKAAVDGESGGHLWMRVDRPNRQTGFFDNMGDRPVVSNEWKTYEITGDVADDALFIYIGCFLRGAGTIWLDDVDVAVLVNGQWKPVEIPNAGFETDSAGTEPASWGRGSSSYSVLATRETAAKGLSSLKIKNLPPSNGAGLFEESPLVGECTKRDLGNGISVILPLALYADSTGTLPHGNSAKLKELAESLAQGKIVHPPTGDSLYTRLGDMVIAWNVSKHFYPYFDIEKVDWEAALTEGLSNAFNDRNKTDFLWTIRRMNAHLNDGHGRVQLAKDSTSMFAPPIEWEWIEDKLVVTNLMDSLNRIDGKIHVGDIVESIDGVTALPALQHEEEYISGATSQWKRYRSLLSLLFGEQNSKLSLDVRYRDGSTAKITLNRNMSTFDYYAGAAQMKRPMFRMISDSIVYVDLNSLTDDTLSSFLPKLTAARGIVLDMRGYPRGADILSYLTDQPMTSARWNIPKTLYPDHERSVDFDTSGRWNIMPKEPRLTAKLAFVIDGEAISFAETVMGIVEYYKLGEIVGQTTAGTNGDVNTLELPGGYYVSFTGMKVVKHDGSQHHGVGIHPIVPIARTIKGVQEGKDELLEKALEVVSK